MSAILDYKCEFCGEFASSKSNLDRHQKIKKACIEIQKSKGLKVNNPNIKCEYCNRDYHVLSLKAHIKTCRVRKEQDNTINVDIVNIPSIEDQKDDIENEEEHNYIYCLIEREFLKTKETIYKVGKTNNINKRIKQYPKGSQMIAYIKVKDCHKAEKELLTILDSVVQRAPEIGREYYNCQLKSLLPTFYKVAMDNSL